MTSSQNRDLYQQQAAEVFTAGIADLRSALTQLGPIHLESLQRMATDILNSWQNGGKLLVCGNGGSAADSQHIVAEMVGRFQAERPAFAAIALTVNTSILTAVSNDYGFADVFARQVEGLGYSKDVLIVLSTSGESENCVRAVTAAKLIGMPVHGLLGGDGGRLAEQVDCALLAPGATTARIQEVHITLGHLLCDLLEKWQIAWLAGSSEDGA